MFIVAVDSPAFLRGNDYHWEICTIQAARSTMRRGDFRVLAAAFNSGACCHAEAVSTPRL